MTLGRLQGWLHARKHFYPGHWLGNRLSDLRFYCWRLFGGGR